MHCREVVKEQRKKIDAVPRTLRDAVEIKKADYSTSGLVSMIGISRDIEERLEENLMERRENNLPNFEKKETE